jgi:hypothetical protein
MILEEAYGQEHRPADQGRHVEEGGGPHDGNLRGRGAELYKRITANSLQVGIAYGSPVLTGRYYASHTIARGRIDKTVREPNPEGEENPYPGLPLTNAAATCSDPRT